MKHMYLFWILILAIFLKANIGLSYSDTYDEVIRNNDGSTIIVNPRFKNPSGEGPLPINYHRSNSAGVCRLFGYQSYRTATAPNEYPRTAVIDSKGHFDYFEESYYRRGIELLLCSEPFDDNPLNNLEAIPTIENRSLGHWVNDDGSTTINQPYIKGPKDSKIWISSTSYLVGICKYFGFNEFEEWLTDGDYPLTGVLTANGKFGYFREDNYSDFNRRVTLIPDFDRWSAILGV